ncbi:MAG TPA: amidohydrolase family protein [Gemmatimonadaceae bacterium]|jgi:5-methylthioadenosine/S-adenosylhomocysteine deaminase
MSARRTRYHARWVLPVATPPIADGTVVVDGDCIAWVGPRADAPAGGVDDDLGDAVLLPGLVNAHTHLELTVMRGFLEELAFFDWVRTLTRARHFVLDDAALLDSARLGVVEGLRAGITTFADTGDSSAPFDALRELGARGIAFREVFGPDPRQVETSLAGLREKVQAMRAHETALVKVGVSPHAPYSVSDALFAAVAAYAAPEHLPVAVHIAESEEESRLVERAQGPFADFLRSRGLDVEARARSPIALLERCGVLDAGPLLIHAVRADAPDIARMAQHRCGVAHCPASNAKLGHGIAPLSDMLAAGLAVGLGSDSMASNNRMDILGEGRLAMLQQRSRARRPDALPAQHVLELATLGGARALRLDGTIGVLAEGYQADLAAFALHDATGPVHDIAAAVVHAGGTPAVRTVVAGRLRVRDGAVLHADESLARRVQHTAEALGRWRRADPGQ